LDENGDLRFGALGHKVFFVLGVRKPYERPSYPLGGVPLSTFQKTFRLCAKTR
jgi:hypothetical protein